MPTKNHRTPAFEATVAHRRYRWRDPSGKKHPVDVRVMGPPRRSRGDWACLLRITGLPSNRSFSQLTYGVDGLQALELAIRNAGAILSRTPEFEAGELECFGVPIRDKFALGLPLCFSSIGGALENLRDMIKREMGGRRNQEWRDGTLVVMKELALDFAELTRSLRSRRSRYAEKPAHSTGGLESSTHKGARQRKI